MNAAFLVSREMEQAFDARVKEIGQQYDKLTFKYTGPWPPYNFVNIRLKLERASLGVAVLIIDSLIISGVRFVLDKVAAAVETEMNDDSVAARAAARLRRCASSWAR